MISKSHRFPMRTQFLSLKNEGKKLVSQRLLVYSRPSPTLRLAVVIPKKANKSAVFRNRLRRRLLSLLLETLANTPVDLVVVLKPSPLNAATEKDVLSELSVLVSGLLPHEQ